MSVQCAMQHLPGLAVHRGSHWLLERMKLQKAASCSLTAFTSLVHIGHRGVHVATGPCNQVAGRFTDIVFVSVLAAVILYAGQAKGTPRASQVHAIMEKVLSSSPEATCIYACLSYLVAPCCCGGCGVSLN